MTEPRCPAHRGFLRTPCRMRALPLPLGEVPEAERVIFALSVGFAASSPRVGAKGDGL